jgi:hypothetical protein
VFSVSGGLDSSGVSGNRIRKTGLLGSTTSFSAASAGEVGLLIGLVLVVSSTASSGFAGIVKRCFAVVAFQFGLAVFRTRFVADDSGVRAGAVKSGGALSFLDAEEPDDEG